MAKTKTSSARTRAAVRETPRETELRHPVACTHCGDVGHCWMCWLFKSLIVLFSAFLVLWIGFYMGMLATRGNRTPLDPALEHLLRYRKVCASSSMTMSNDMSKASMERMLGNMTSTLADKDGDAFDKEFALQMTIHHQGAVEMAKLALEKSKRSEVKDLAQSIIDSQSKEIETMKNWLSAWSK